MLNSELKIIAASEISIMLSVLFVTINLVQYKN